MDGSVQRDTLPLADRVNTLFRVWRKAGEPERTNEAVVAEVSRFGGVLSVESLRRLRDGEAVHLDGSTLTALAACFHTDARYLLGDGREIHEELLLLEQMVATNVRSIHLRGQRTDAARREVTRVLATRPTTPAS